MQINVHFHPLALCKFVNQAKQLVELFLHSGTIKWSQRKQAQQDDIEAPVDIYA